MDDNIRATYVSDSEATLSTKLYDAYVRFFRWAVDRLQDQDGIICFVTNNGFLQGRAFDGFRKHLAQDFTEIYHLDLGGNARKRGGGSVFDIMVGVGITLLVRRRKSLARPYPPATVHYHAFDDTMSGFEKLDGLKKAVSVDELEWKILKPDVKGDWMTEALQGDFNDFLPLASKEAKASKSVDAKTIFKAYSLGVSTNRDSVVYDFDAKKLKARVEQFISNYNDEIRRWQGAGRPKAIDSFVDYDNVKWSEHLKAELKRQKFGDYKDSAVRESVYRPFCKQFLYYSTLLNDRPGMFNKILPSSTSENSIIWLKIGSELPQFSLMTNSTPNLLPQGGSQCFPLYTYADNGAIRRDNITDWALGQFQDKYGPAVTKRDIFHYVYGLLHSPEYRERYKENLKRELPRIPLVGGEPTPSPQVWGAGLEQTGEDKAGEDKAGEDKAGEDKRAGASPAPTGYPDGTSQNWGGGTSFHAFVAAGEALAALHIGYETAEEYPLTQMVNKDVPFTWRVTKMRLNKEKTALVINEALTLGGIPPEVYDYKLGNRSALEWVIDQHQVSTDKRSGIVTDPNRADDQEYIVRLVRRVVRVSLETRRWVAGLPTLGLGMAKEEK